MNICADLHIHTIASTHAFSTINEICAQAALAGMKAVAITDHGPAMDDSPHHWHFYGLNGLPRVINGVFTLRGAEVNVTDEAGTLDVTAPLDFIIVSMHHEAYRPSDRDRHTQAWLAMCDNPLVDCLGHTGQPDFMFDYERVVKRCADTGTMIEINNSSRGIRRGSWPNCYEIAKLCKKHGVTVVVTSDAHTAWKVGDFPNSLELLAEIDFPEELVLNADWERFKAYFKERKKLEIE